MRSSICLVTRPSSDFVGFISLTLGLFLKFSLWSFRVMKAGLGIVLSILSLMFRVLAIELNSLSISSIVSGSAIFYFAVMFSLSFFLYSSDFI